jgi:hypothetical protein
MSPPASGLRGNQNSVGRFFMSASCFIYFLNVKEHVTFFSGSYVDSQRTKRRYFPEDITLLVHRCEDLKPKLNDILVHSLLTYTTFHLVG